MAGAPKGLKMTSRECAGKYVAWQHDSAVSAAKLRFPQPANARAAL
jgi:hypothetical protein